MAVLSSESTMDGLSKKSVSYLRVLFDILDENKAGLVKLSDIENHWEDGDVDGLPPGVMEAMRKVTPTGGLLTFERFIAGLKIAMLRSRSDQSKRTVDSTASHANIPEFNTANSVVDRSCSPSGRESALVTDDREAGVSTNREYLSKPPSCPTSPKSHQNHQYQAMVNSKDALDLVYGNNGDMRNGVHLNANHLNSLAPHRNGKEQDSVHPLSQSMRPFKSASMMPSTIGNGMTHQSRTYSLPHLAPWELENDALSPICEPFNSPDEGSIRIHGDYPITPKSTYASGTDLRSNSEKENIVSALKQWQHKRMLGTNPKPVRAESHYPRWPGDGRASIASASALISSNINSYGSDVKDDAVFESPRQKSRARRDSRRHTLTNGIDFHTIARLKQLEAERDVLLQGLTVVEHARTWYQQQLQQVHDRHKYIGSPAATTDASVEAQGERARLQAARIQEANGQLQALMDSSHKGLPLHMNLAVMPHPVSPDKHSLKSENLQLSQELTEKSNRINQLEYEKSQLIREMFQATSKNKDVNYDDTTFI